MAFSGMLDEKEVTWFPSYGAEVRGGTANCTVIISDELIGSPVVRNPDMLIIMNDASLNKFHPTIKQQGLLIYDSSLIKTPHLRSDIKCEGIPATEIASRIGNTKSANMVLLGACIAKTGLFRKSHALQAVVNSLPESKRKLIDQNKEAIIKGISYFENSKSKNI